jgi:hypothetical protein
MSGIPLTADQARDARAAFDAGEPYVLIVEGDPRLAPGLWEGLHNHPVLLESSGERVARAAVHVVPVVDRDQHSHA